MCPNTPSTSNTILVPRSVWALVLAVGACASGMAATYATWLGARVVDHQQRLARIEAKLDLVCRQKSLVVLSIGPTRKSTMPRHRHKPIQAGKQNVLVEIQEHDGVTTTRGAKDNAAAHWPVKAEAWVELELLGGRELEVARGLYAHASHRGKMRYRTDVVLSPKHRLKQKGVARFFGIGMVGDVGERHVQWELALGESVSGD